MINQRGKAAWTGDITGHGTISTQSGLIDVPYSVGTRFEGQKGSNPEELIGAAHAACYTMYLTSILTTAGHEITGIDTTSVVSMDPNTGSPNITHIHIKTEGRVSGLTPEEFQAFAEDAKANCPISRALAAVPEMSVEAQLIS